MVRSLPFLFSLTCLWSASIVMPSRSHSMTRVELSPALLEVWVSPEHLFLDLILFGYHLDEELHCRPLPPIVMSSPVHGCHDVLSLDAASPHARARASPRQSETAERRCQFLFHICAASRVPYRLYRSSPHMCSSPGWQSSGGNSTNAFLRAGA